MTDPKLCSLKSEMWDMEKAPVNRLLGDDWNATNSMGGSIKVASVSPGNWLKYNSKLAVETPDGSVTHKYSDNVQMGLRLWGLGAKAQVKGGRFYEHYALLNRSFAAPWNKAKNIDVHSYARWGATTAMQKWVYTKGWAVRWCENATSRFQVNYNPSSAAEGVSAWSGNARHYMNWNNLWVNLAYAVNASNLWNSVKRDFRVGYNVPDVGLSFYLQGQKDNEDKDAPFFESRTLGFSYQKCKWDLGAWWTSYTDGQASRMEAGVGRQLCPRSSVKGKVDNNGNLNLFTRVKAMDGVKAELSLATNVCDPGSVGGLYDLPVNFGIKLKIDK